MLVPGLNARWSERSRRRPIASTKYFIRNPRIKKQRTRASIIRCRTLKATYTYNADFPGYPGKINVRRSFCYLFRKRNVPIDGMCLPLRHGGRKPAGVRYARPFRRYGKIAEKLWTVWTAKICNVPYYGMIEGKAARRQSTRTERRMRRSKRSILVARRE
jgi:hypothetical protein